MITEVVRLVMRERRTPQTERELRKTLSLLTEQDGFVRARWGWEEENPGNCWLLVVWTSIEAHRNFQAKDYYYPFVGDLNNITDINKILAFHTQLLPEPTTNVSSKNVSPITEICMVHFPVNYPPDSRKQLEENVAKVVAVADASVKESMGFVGGWSLETVLVPGTLETSTVYIFSQGWPSVQAHNEFRDSPAFKANKHLLDQAIAVRHIQMIHVTTTQVDGHGQF